MKREQSRSVTEELGESGAKGMNMCMISGRVVGVCMIVGVGKAS